MLQQVGKVWNSKNNNTKQQLCLEKMQSIVRKANFCVWNGTYSEVTLFPEWMFQIIAWAWQRTWFTKYMRSQVHETSLARKRERFSGTEMVDTIQCHQFLLNLNQNLNWDSSPCLQPFRCMDILGVSGYLQCQTNAMVFSNNDWCGLKHLLTDKRWLRLLQLNQVLSAMQDQITHVWTKMALQTNAMVIFSFFSPSKEGSYGHSSIIWSHESNKMHLYWQIRLWIEQE